jgi:integrase/recombinase XerD
MGKEIYNIINDMAEVLNASQMQKLQEVLVNRLSENRAPDYLRTSNKEFLDMFLTAKHLEGCSDKTIRYYRCNIQRMLETVDVPVIKISTEMLRKYLVEYQSINNCGKVTIDNVRRSLSTFFSWLEEEDYIIKSPMKRIHKVKTAVVVKETLPDEKVEILRDNCGNLRDRAMIDFLLSTGIRVGELVRLNIEDIDFSERECVVYGKGDKERKAYFDAKAKLHLMNYIESRTDNNKALFVSLNRPHDRLTESGVELRLREMGKKLGVEKVHPHKFRRTMATRAIEKGMPIEQVQKILGHEQIDTTLRYAMVNQNNVKLSHRKYIS